MGAKKKKADTGEEEEVSKYDTKEDEDKGEGRALYSASPGGAIERVDFTDIGKRIANIEDRHSINQLGPATTDAFLKASKYTDEDGKVHFKTEFTRDEIHGYHDADGEYIKGVGDLIYDELVAHVHKRTFKMGTDKFEELLKVKDADGNPYVDTVAQYEFNLSRQELKDRLGKAEEGNRVDYQRIQQVLNPSINRHAGLIQQKVLTRYKINDPEHTEKVKGAIEDIVKEFDIKDKRFKTEGMHDPEEVQSAYVELVNTYLKDKGYEG